MILQLNSVHLWGPKVQRATGRFGRTMRTLPLTVPTARSAPTRPATVTRSTIRRLPSGNLSTTSVLNEPSARRLTASK